MAKKKKDMKVRVRGWPKKIKYRETPARKRVDFFAILSFSRHGTFSEFLSLSRDRCSSLLLNTVLKLSGKAKGPKFVIFRSRSMAAKEVESYNLKSSCFKTLKNHLRTWRYQVSLF